MLSEVCGYLQKMVGEDEQFLPDLDRELKSFIRGERNGNKELL